MNKPVKILFVGDIFIGEKDNLIVMNDIKKVIESSDIVSCNFEGPIETKKTKPILKAGPNLQQREDSPEQIMKMGFNLINLANNHIMDYGGVALEKTLNKFKKQNLLGAGKDFNEAYKLKIIKANNLKIGFLSFSEWGFGVINPKNENSFGFAWINHPKTNRIIGESKKKVDFLIIQIHAGEEDLHLPQPEWRKRYKEIINLGADLIIGHHPHVPQPIEFYKGKMIAYSLGNFYFKKFQGRKNYIIQIKILKNRVIEYKIYPIVQKKEEIKIVPDKKLKGWIKNYFIEKNEEEYKKEYNHIAQKRYKEIYKIYFNEKKIIRLIKNLIKIILFRKIQSKKLIMEHLKKRESHYFLIKRYRKDIK